MLAVVQEGWKLREELLQIAAEHDALAEEAEELRAKASTGHVDAKGFREGMAARRESKAAGLAKKFDDGLKRFTAMRATSPLIPPLIGETPQAFAIRKRIFENLATLERMKRAPRDLFLSGPRAREIRDLESEIACDLRTLQRVEAEAGNGPDAA